MTLGRADALAMWVAMSEKEQLGVWERALERAIAQGQSPVDWAFTMFSTSSDMIECAIKHEWETLDKS